MHKLVFYIPETILFRAGSQIPIFVEVPPESPIDAGHHTKNTNVEFPFIYEKRFFYILLDDQSVVNFVIVDYFRVILKLLYPHFAYFRF